MRGGSARARRRRRGSGPGRVSLAGGAQAGREGHLRSHRRRKGPSHNGYTLRARVSTYFSI